MSFWSRVTEGPRCSTECRALVGESTGRLHAAETGLGAIPSWASARVRVRWRFVDGGAWRGSVGGSAVLACRRGRGWPAPVGGGGDDGGGGEGGRGKVGGESFERTLTVAIKPTSAKGNAFVPRLYAAAAIGDLEKDPTDDAKKQAIALSSEFSVASRHTSLLVLESQAMFKAFGLDNSRRAPTWTGEDAAESTVGASADDAPDEDADESVASSKDAFDGIGATGSVAKGGTAGPGGGGFAAPPQASPPPAPKPAQPKKAKKPASKRRPLDLDIAGGNSWEPPRRRPRPRRMIPMRRIFERKATIVTSRKVPAKAEVSKLLEAERKVQGEPNNRTAVQNLFTLYALSGNAARSSQVAERWSTKDPLDPAALTARADVAASSGNRELAIRILGSVVDVRPEDIASQKRLARLHRWAGRPELGCRHALAIAQIRSRDAKLLTQAVRCARETGMSSMGDDMLRAASKRTRAVAEATAQEEPPQGRAPWNVQGRSDVGGGWRRRLGSCDPPPGRPPRVMAGRANQVDHHRHRCEEPQSRGASARRSQKRRVRGRGGASLRSGPSQRHPDDQCCWYP